MLTISVQHVQRRDRDSNLGTCSTTVFKTAAIDHSATSFKSANILIFFHELIVLHFEQRIYPQNFEQKIGFDQIRQLLKDKCLSTLGEERVDGHGFSENFEEVEEIKPGN